MALLEAEREALLTGRLEELGAISEKKERSLAACARAPEHLRSAPELTSALRRNQQLLEAALQGLSEVTSRLGAPRALLNRMVIYDPSGRKTQIGPSQTPSVRRKF